MQIYLRERELKETFDECIDELQLKDPKAIDPIELTELITSKYKEKTKYDEQNNALPNFAKVMRAIVKVVELYIPQNPKIGIARWLEMILEGIHKMQFVETKITAYLPSEFGEVLPLKDDKRATENDFAVAIYGWSNSSISIRWREVKAASIKFIETTTAQFAELDKASLTTGAAKLRI